MTVDRQTKFEDLPDFLKVEEFCAYLGIGRTSAYDLVRRGAIQPLRLGRRIWIPKTALKTDHSDRANLVKFTL
ncbi:MAG: helix-turn-helix domain-containing protein [Acidobacteria bacterium]|nr:helix-turn-helix domain-containing protein [Acidobacteriota bacterium]